MKIILFANTDWYLYNFRRELALALQRRGDEVVLLSPPGDYASRLQEMGFRWLEFPLSRRGMNPLAELGAVWRLFRLYRREKPDLVHHFTVKCVLYGSLAGHFARVKGIVNSITGLGYIFLPGNVFKKVLRTFILMWYRLVLRQTKAIFENNDDRQAFLDYKLMSGQDAYLVNGVGINTDLFQLTPEPEGTPVILLASRILWDKGVGEFVEAAKIVREMGLAARFALAGRVDTGNPASIPLEQVEGWHASGLVEWWGWQEDMPSLFARVHLVTLPSYREGLPTVLMEAAACGKAVITTDVPGCRDVIRAGETGLLVPVRDAKSLAQACARMLEDAALRQAMGRAGRDLALGEFSSDSALKKITGIYADIFGGETA